MIAARELREFIRKLEGVNDSNVKAILDFCVRIAEDNRALSHQVLQLAQMFDGLVNNQITQANAFSKMQAMLPHFQKLKQQGMQVSSDPTLTGEASEDGDGR